MSHCSAVCLSFTLLDFIVASLCVKREFLRNALILIMSRIKILSTGMLKVNHHVCVGCCCSLLPPEAAVVLAATSHSKTDTRTAADTFVLNALCSNTYMHTLTWGHSCSAPWIWESAWQRSRLPADIAPVWCLQWNWTCQTWPGRILRMSCCCFHHLKGNLFTVKLH